MKKIIDNAIFFGFILFVFVIGNLIGYYLTFLFQFLLFVLILAFSYVSIYKTSSNDGGVIIFYGILVLIVSGILFGNLFILNGIELTSVQVFR